MWSLTRAHSWKLPASLYLYFGVQNVGNGISELQDFKILWGACPQTFLEDGGLWPLNCHSCLLHFSNHLLIYYCKGVFLWKNPKIFPLWSQITQIPHSQRDEEPISFSLHADSLVNNVDAKQKILVHVPSWIQKSIIGFFQRNAP